MNKDILMYILSFEIFKTQKLEERAPHGQTIVQQVRHQWEVISMNLIRFLSLPYSKNRFILLVVLLLCLAKACRIG